MDADDAFISKLRDVLGGDEFDTKVRRFLKKNARLVVRECESGDDTGSMEAYQIFKEYLALYEDTLEIFHEKEELTAAEFKKKLERILETNICAKFMIKYLLIALEFESFLDYCKDFVSQESKKADEEENSDEEEGSKVPSSKISGK